MTTKSFRRYTSLPFLLDILNKKTLTFLDPESWDDKNDSYFIERYKNINNLKSVLALCFAETEEMYHHWKIYSGNTSGVCIEFIIDNLLACTEGNGVRGQLVIYKTKDQLEINDIDICQLPFIKRHAFKDELEYRLIYESELEKIPSKEVPIKINCILRIIINPWIPKSVFDSVKAVIMKIDGCKDIKIIRSSLLENEKWKKVCDDKLNSLIAPIS